MSGDSGLLVTVCASLFVSGLAGSLHCIGMCGPILAGFAQLFRGEEDDANAGSRGLALDFASYHAGRIWTYALLGLGAGFVGQGARHGAALIGWQRPIGVAAGIAVVLTGVALLGWLPGLGVERLPAGCDFARLRTNPWLRGLVGSRSLVARLLLGAVMGFLPCGLVYAMLVVVAALPHPAWSALGMAVFGLGTVPSLAAVLAMARVVPARLRVHGTRLAAVALLATGTWMTVRAATVTPGANGCAACVEDGVPAVQADGP